MVSGRTIVIPCFVHYFLFKAKDSLVKSKPIQPFVPTEVRLHEAEAIETRLEQGIRSREDAVDGDCCVRARGLPWQASDQDIARFFVGLNVAK